MEITDKSKHFGDQRNDLSGLVISGKEQIKSGAAAHRAEVYSLVGKGRVVAKEGSTEMLDGMNFSGVHYRFLVWGSHAKIKGSDRFSTNMVFA